jgi:hypothetical protein
VDSWREGRCTGAGDFGRFFLDRSCKSTRTLDDEERKSFRLAKQSCGAFSIEFPVRDLPGQRRGVDCIEWTEAQLRELIAFAHV